MHIDKENTNTKILLSSNLNQFKLYITITAQPNCPMSKKDQKYSYKWAHFNIIIKL